MDTPVVHADFRAHSPPPPPPPLAAPSRTASVPVDDTPGKAPAAPPVDAVSAYPPPSPPLAPPPPAPDTVHGAPADVDGWDTMEALHDRAHGHLSALQAAIEAQNFTFGEADMAPIPRFREMFGRRLGPEYMGNTHQYNFLVSGPLNSRMVVKTPDAGSVLEGARKWVKGDFKFFDYIPPLMALSEECGMLPVFPRQWVAPFHGRFNGTDISTNEAVYIEYVDGMTSGNFDKPEHFANVFTSFPDWQIRAIALLDVWLSYTDRHASNVMIDGNNNAFSIDAIQHTLAQNPTKAVDSIFLPGTWKWALVHWNYQNTGNPPRAQHGTAQANTELVQKAHGAATIPRTQMLRSFDYRCHARDGKIGFDYPPTFAKCLAKISAMEPEEIQRSYGLPLLKDAMMLHTVSRDMHRLGFEGALDRQIARTILLTTDTHIHEPAALHSARPCCTGHCAADGVNFTAEPARVITDVLDLPSMANAPLSIERELWPSLNKPPLTDPSLSWHSAPSPPPTACADTATPSPRHRLVFHGPGWVEAPAHTHWAPPGTPEVAVPPVREAVDGAWTAHAPLASVAGTEPSSGGATGVAAATDSVFYVTPEGGVVSCGHNGTWLDGGGVGARYAWDAGILGRWQRDGEAPGGCAPVPFPAGTRVTAVSASTTHVLAVSEDGKIFCWGLNDFAQCGRRPKRMGTGVGSAYGDQSVPMGDLLDAYAVARPVRAFARLDPLVKWVGVSAGPHYSLAVAADGRLATAGLNLCGLVGDLDWVLKPPLTGAPTEMLERVLLGRLTDARWVSSERPLTIASASAGHRHLAVVTAMGGAYGGVVLTCATGFDGHAGAWRQAATGMFEARPHPSLSDLLGHLNVHRYALARVPLPRACATVAASVFRTVAVTADGTRVYTWGDQEMVLAHGSPARVSPLRKLVTWDVALLAQSHALPAGTPVPEAVTDVAVSVRFMAFRDTCGRVWTVGRSAHHAELVSQITACEGGIAVNPRGVWCAGARVTADDAWTEGVRVARTLKAWWTSDPPRMAPRMFERVPAVPFPRFANPCWFTPAGLSCLPGFNILGVSKCGTTNLFHKALGHPQIRGGNNKGPHFWDERRMLWEEYSHLFVDVADEILHEDQPQLIAGEASSNTLSYADVGVRGHRDPMLSPGWNTPALLRHLQPSMRLVVMTRAPISRLLSSFFYYHRKYTQLSAAEALKTFREWSERMLGVVEGAIPDPRPQPADPVWRKILAANFVPAEQIIKGVYSVPLRAYLQHFPASQILLIDIASMREPESTRHVFNTFFEFIGVPTGDEIPAEAWDTKIMAKKVSNKMSYPLTVKDIPDDITQRLEAFYAPFQDDLQRLAEELITP